MSEPATPLNSVARMPVREVTVFKDGHAFVLHEGEMPTEDGGNVVIDQLPTPVLGTFWPYSIQKGTRLTSVVAGKRRVLIPRTALTLQQLIEANPGAEVKVEELSGAGTNARTVTYDATLIGVPVRSSDELEETSPRDGSEQLPQKGSVVLLKTDSGVAVLPIDRVQTITFKGAHKQKVSDEEFRTLLSLKLKWDNNPDKSANVGMIYLQKGLRWIPSYKVNLHSDGAADIKLQATLVNELTDLKDVSAHLVVGVPSFAFEDQIDPMAIQKTIAELSAHYNANARMARSMSNAIMSQVASQPMNIGGDDAADTGPEVSPSGEKNEDLFVFTANHITLKKGQRMVVPIAEYSLKYKDLYQLEIPFTPPPEVRMSHRPPDAELAKLTSVPKVMHKIRLTNKSTFPLTTAPALILKNDKLISQGMMTYAGINGNADLSLTTAVDIGVEKTETETKRTADAIKWQGDSYGKVDLTGKIKLTNFSNKPVHIEVKRLVLGKVGTVADNGKVEMLNVFEDLRTTSDSERWRWYDWPHWWTRVNSISQAVWNLALEPGKAQELNYDWYYYWR